MSAPAAKWNQNAEGLSLMLPTAKYTSPTKRVTTALQLPPPEITSVKKTQPTNTPIDAMKGNLKRRMSSRTARSTSSSSESRATEKPANGEPEVLLCSQPNHDQRAPTKDAQAITEANANMPAAVQRSRCFSACAMPYSTTSMSAAHPAYAAA